jgi:hypothetical protein
MIQGRSLAQVDPLIEKVLQAAPAILADGAGNKAVAESLAETLVTAMESGETVSAERHIHELLLLVNSRPTQPSETASFQLSSWLDRQKGLGGLKPTGPVTRALAASLDETWIVALDGVVYAVDSVDKVSETYAGRTWTWREVILVRLRDGVFSSLTCEEDDGVEFSHAIAQLTLKDLNIDARKAWQMMEDEEGRLQYQGRTFEVFDSGTAVYARGRTGEKEEYDYVSLQEPGGLYIDLEDWGDEVEAFLIEHIDSRRLLFATRGVRH